MQDFQAADYPAEDVYRTTQEDRDDVSPHAAHHDAGTA